MDFLDSLENSLKSLESVEERDTGTQKRRLDDRARALAIAPWAEKLKHSDFTKRLMDEAAVTGHRLRMKIYMAWIDTTLRLEARERRLELRPTPDGIVAGFIEPSGETKDQPVSLESDPADLLKTWLG